MTEHDAVVRITNVQIFEELRKARSDVASVKQTMEETVKPGLADARSDIRTLFETKAGKADTEARESKIERDLNSVRLQAYAIGSGVVAGLLALRTLGVI